MENNTYCKNCGAEPKEGQTYCVECGTPISRSNAQPSSFFASIASKMNRGRIIGAVIVLILIGLGIYGNRNDNAINTNNAAIVNSDAGNNQQAITQFREASANATENDTKIATLINLAYAYSNDNNSVSALSTFKQALSLTSDETFEHYLASGEIALLENRPDDAVTNYNKAYQMQPDDFQINNALSLFYLDLDEAASQHTDYAKALPYAQKAYDISKLEIAKQNLAAAYYFNKNYDQAISLLSSLTLDKNSYTAYMLGLSYARKGDVANAKIYLKEAIDNNVKVPQSVYDYLKTH